jgi:hypothetical protein
MVPQKGCDQIVSPVLVEDTMRYKRLPVPGQQIVENYQESPQEQLILKPQVPGGAITTCGYNPEQIMYNLPSNMPAGNCRQTQQMSTYNKNLFTQTVTPGLYTTNQVNEPINANIGISFQQQFEPVTSSVDEYGTHYLRHDPSIIEPNVEDPSQVSIEKPRYDNVYDPRFYGYGTSYRSYLDPHLGQTKFMYDDINAIRMPNYVIRSKIDHLPYADKYDSVQEGSEMGNVHNPNIRQLVQESWLNDSLQFRNDLMDLRMRKINSEGWQRRQAPLGPNRR